MLAAFLQMIAEKAKAGLGLETAPSIFRKRGEQKPTVRHNRWERTWDRGNSTTSTPAAILPEE